MPRPKGSYKTPEQLAAMSPERRKQYENFHKYYMKKIKPAREAPSAYATYMQRAQARIDAQEVDWDTFPVSTLREWLRSNAKTVGDCRKKASRWGITNGLLKWLLQGFRLPKAHVLQKIQLDTLISIERLISEFDEVKLSTGAPSGPCFGERTSPSEKEGQDQDED